MHRSVIAGSSGSHVFSLTKSQTVSPSGCPILHPHQQCTGDLVSPLPHQHLVAVLFLILAALLGVW